MLRIRSLRVTAQSADTERCAEYCAQTRRLRILKDGALLREWVSAKFVDGHCVCRRRPQLGNTARFE